MILSKFVEFRHNSFHSLEDTDRDLRLPLAGCGRGRQRKTLNGKGCMYSMISVALDKRVHNVRLRPAMY